MLTCGRARLADAPEEPRWREGAEGGGEGVGGGTRAAKALVRVQLALGQVQARHAYTQEVMRPETRAAHLVLQRCMAAAPTLALDETDNIRLPYPYPPHRPQGLAGGNLGQVEGNGGEIGGSREAEGDEDGAQSVRSGRSGRSRASSISFASGFDLSSALESTQVLELRPVCTRASARVCLLLCGRQGGS